MAQLDGRDLVESDPFILCGADVVASLPLAPVIAAHHARKARDGDAKTTILFKACGAPGECSRTRALTDDVVVATDAASGRLLVYSDEVIATHTHNKQKTKEQK